MKSLLTIIKNNWLAFMGFIFVVVIPVIMLIELVSRSNTFLGIKIGFGFCIVALVIFFIARSRLKKLAEKVKSKVTKQVILAILLGTLWALGIVIIIGIAAIASRLEAFWYRVGICFVIGSAFYIIHAIQKGNLANNG